MGEQTIHRSERVVHGMTERISGYRGRHAPFRRSGEAGHQGERSAERLQNPVELHSHLIGERPACVVVRRSRRAAGIRDVVRVVLRLEHVEDVRPKRLRRLHHVGACRVVFPAHFERHRGALDGDSGLDQRVDELRRGEKVRLIGRYDVPARVPVGRIPHDADVRRHIGRTRRLRTTTATAGVTALRAGAVLRHRCLERGHLPWCNSPRVGIAAPNRISPHLVDVEEERLAITRRHVQHRPVRRQLVGDGLREVPLLRLNRHRQISLRQELVRHQGNFDRRGIADRFREKADHVVEIDGRPEPAVPPGGIARAAPHRRARLPLGDEPRMHRRSDQVELHRDERIVVVVERVAERRSEDHRPDRPRLVMVVHDLRIPGPEQNAVHRLRLGLRCHVGVTVVVVTGVLVVEPRQPRSRPLERVCLPHVPVGHQLLSIRIRGHQQDDVVAEESERLRIAFAHELVHHLNQLLRAQHFAGVKTSVYPHDGLPF